ncbi:MAG: hypothetical protein J6Y60_11615 [Treponema sp.]|nr:hypothetical protein [Treponema sp.]
MKKRVLIMVLSLACLIAFAKPRPKEESPKEKTLMERGLSLIDFMLEKASSDAYMEMFMNTELGWKENANKIKAGDYSKPTAVYRLVKNSSTSVIQFMADMVDYDLSVFTPRLKEDMENQMFFGFASLWNMRCGIYDVALSGTLSSGSVFDSDELKEDCIYIYTYKDAYPVAVSFKRGEGKACSASAIFIMDKDFPNNLIQMLEGFNVGIKLEKIM